MNSSIRLLIAFTLCAFCLQRLHSEDNAAAPSIEGVEWTLQEIHGKPAHAEGLRNQTLKLDPAKQQAVGNAGVNRFFGSFERTDDRLKIGRLATTRMAGPPEAMNAEKAYLAALSEITNWRMSDGALELLKEKTVVLRFAAAKPTPK